MSESFDALAADIVRLVGGPDNITWVSNCATRLRFRLADDGRADREALMKREGVLTLVESGGQFQIVIGPKVPDVYAAVAKILPQKEAAAPAEKKAAAAPPSPAGFKDRVLLLLQAIVAPVVPALAGAGMMKAILLLLGTAGLGWIDPASASYKILMAASNSTFFFMPLLFAYSTAKAVDVPITNALIIVGALMEPNFTGLMKNPGDIVSFFGMPVVLMNYASSLIPAVATVLAYSWLHRRLERWVPTNLSLFIVPMLALLIMVPLAAIVIGPCAIYLGMGLAKLVTFLNGTSGLLLGAVIGAGWSYLVILGIHASVVPIMLNNFATLGFDTIRPPIACATFSQGGAALGLFLRSKNKKTKAFALSCLMPMLLGGITEPILYGISIRYRRPMIAATIGACVGGAFMGAMTVKAYAYIFPSLITLPAFFGATFVYYLIGIAIAFFLTAFLTYVFGVDEGPIDAEDL